MSETPRTENKCLCEIYYGGLGIELNPKCPIHGHRTEKLTDKELVDRFEQELFDTRNKLQQVEEELNTSVDRQVKSERELAAARAELERTK